jgi:folate-binding protein YgfZ
VLREVLGDGADYDSWAEGRNAQTTLAGSPVVVTKASMLVVPGFCVYTGRAPELRSALGTAGAITASPDVIETARIEAGYPVFGLDLTHDTIPLEAGIEDRAISFTKGCYVGQEVIIRVLHRGHGRVARKLVGLRVDDVVPTRGARIRSAEREIGHVTSAARSPRLGAIALGYVHRDFVTPGTRVEVDIDSGRVRAAVSELPFSATLDSSPS